MTDYPSPVAYVLEFHETYGAAIRDTPVARPPEAEMRYPSSYPPSGTRSPVSRSRTICATTRFR